MTGWESITTSFNSVMRSRTKGNMRLNCKENYFNCEIWKRESATNTRSSQSIKIGIDLSIDKSMKIGISDLIDIDCIDRSVEIDDTLVSFIDLSRFKRSHRSYIGRYISFSVHPKMKTDFMQTVIC